MLKILGLVLIAVLLFFVTKFVKANSSNDVSLLEGYNSYKAEEYDKAKELLAPLAKSGDPIAQYYMAYIDLNIHDDRKYFAKWIPKSAEQGYPNANRRLAVMYLHGQGVDKDLKKAAELAQTNNEKFQATIDSYSLARMFRKGIGLPKSPDKFVKISLESAFVGDKTAQSNLAEYYGFEERSRENSKKAFAWFSIYAENPSQYDTIYKSNLRSVKKRLTLTELEEAKKLIEQYSLKIASNVEVLVEQANNDNIVAQRKLALAFHKGNIVRKDLVKSYFWYTRVATNNENSQPRWDYWERQLLKLEMSSEEIKQAENLIQSAPRYNK
ncbi:tetratricopeptide repeat protein [Vibrio lentus]